jgi:hypothetical protein
MNRKSLVVLASFIGLAFVLPAHAGRGVSAVRAPSESFESARLRNSHATIFDFDGLVTPVDAKKPLRSLNISEIPEVSSYEELVQEFYYIRDTRFMQSDRPNFMRRMTWMYPDDGCYARAELASDFLQDHHYATPKKMFAFGNLHAKSTNSPSGDVSWWYHVAVTYRVKNVVYILDPALMPARPMTLQEWNDAIGGARANVKYSICEAGTFDPDSDCERPDNMKEEDAEMNQREFFPLEWDRLLELNRDPVQELGNNPPWGH